MTYNMYLYDMLTNIPIGIIIFEDDGGQMGETKYENFDIEDIAQVMEIFSTIDYRKLFYDEDRSPDEYLWNLKMLSIELRDLGFRVLWSPPLPEDLTVPFSVEFPYDTPDDDEVPEGLLEALPE